MKEFSVEVVDIRAERRESRDLMQDMEDIRSGIQVVHASDMEKLEAEAKKERRAIEMTQVTGGFWANFTFSHFFDLK